jgi:hypothetical protein
MLRDFSAAAAFYFCGIDIDRLIPTECFRRAGLAYAKFAAVVSRIFRTL